MDERPRPEDLSEDERQRLHRAHQRMRNASQALEALTVIEPVRGRWAATPAPVEALEAAQLALHDACQELWRAQQELLGLDPPAGASAAG
jgi:hypothetical protein